ncbi:21848_t:CDS:2, partial [Gigaspora rosea]
SKFLELMRIYVFKDNIPNVIEEKVITEHQKNEISLLTAENFDLKMKLSELMNMNAIFSYNYEQAIITLNNKNALIQERFLWKVDILLENQQNEIFLLKTENFNLKELGQISRHLSEEHKKSSEVNRLA